MRQYIGARYVPVFFNNNGTNEWVENTSYEYLTIVSYNNSSYISLQNVPPTIGEPPLNPNYWLLTGNFNAQLNAINENLNKFKEKFIILSEENNFSSAYDKATSQNIPIIIDSDVTIEEATLQNVTLIGYSELYYGKNNPIVTLPDNCTLNNCILISLSISMQLSSLFTTIMFNCQIVSSSSAIYIMRNNSLLLSCLVNNCNIGVTQMVDSKIISCTFNKMNDCAIKLQKGSNDNIILGNKIEWNGGHGIELYQAGSNIISGNIFDRNSKNGLNLIGSGNIVTGNVFKRNAIGYTPSANCYISGINDVRDNLTLQGNNEDDGTGTNGPTYGYYVYNTSIEITGCSPVTHYSNQGATFITPSDKSALIKRPVTVGTSVTLPINIGVSNSVNPMILIIGHRTYSNTDVNVFMLPAWIRGNSFVTANTPEGLEITPLFENNMLVSLTISYKEEEIYPKLIY